MHKYKCIYNSGQPSVVSRVTRGMCFIIGIYDAKAWR